MLISKDEVLGLLPHGVTHIYVEIYDECSFTMDELIAWGRIEIPLHIIRKGETHDDWYMLSGKQGENKEGMINLIFSYTHKIYNSCTNVSPSLMIPTNTIFTTNSYAPVNVYSTPVNDIAVRPSALLNAENELKQIAEMFPHIEMDTIKSIYDINNGLKSSTINVLLQMSE